MEQKIFFYHYKPFKNLEDLRRFKNHINQKIWFTEINEFNDPFDSVANQDGFSNQEALDNDEIFQEFFEIAREIIGPSLTKEAYRSDLQKNRLYKPPKLIPFNNLQKYGAYSMTMKGTNIQMWSHYANNHKGYCIQLELDLEKLYELQKNIPHVDFKIKLKDISKEEFCRNFNKDFISVRKVTSGKATVLFYTEEWLPFFFIKVRYQKKKPTISSKKSLSLKGLKCSTYMAENSIAVKHLGWQYEEEYRLFSIKNSHEIGLIDLLKWGFLKINRIILGNNIGDSVDKDITDFITSYELSNNTLDGTTADEKIKSYLHKCCAETGIDVRITTLNEEDYKIDTMPYTSYPLVQAIKKENVERVKELLELKEVNPNEFYNQNKKMTPLHLVAKSDSLKACQIADLLLKAGVDPLKKNHPDSQVPYQVAQINRCQRMVELLMSAASSKEAK